MGWWHLRAHAASAPDRPWRRALPKTQSDDRASVREHEVQPADRPLSTPRKIRRTLRMATDHRHPQPTEAPQAPNSRYRVLKGLQLANRAMPAPSPRNHRTHGGRDHHHPSRKTPRAAPFTQQPRRRSRRVAAADARACFWRDSGARIVPRLTPAFGRTGASRLRCHLAPFPEDGAGYAGDRPHASLRFSRRSASSRSGSSGSISRELPGGSSGPVSGGGSKIAQFTNWSPSRER